MQEHLSETVGKTKKDDVLNLLARLPYASAEYLDQPDGNLGIVLDERNEIPPFNNHQLAIVDCDGVSRSLPSVEKGDLAEQFPRNDQIKNRVFSLLGWRADPHRTGAHGIKLGADISLPEYDGALFQLCCNHPGCQTLDDRVTQIPEKWVRAKQLVLVKRLRPKTIARPRRHAAFTKQILNKTKDTPYRGSGSILPESIKNKRLASAVAMAARER